MEIDRPALDEGERRQKGRGFQDAGGVEERTRGGAYDSLPVEKTGPGPAKSVEGWVVFVTGVHEEAQEEDVHDAFAEFGEVKSIHLNLDRRTGFVKGYALVEYSTKQEAEAAIAEMDGKELLTRTVNVAWAFSSGPLRKARR